MFSLPAQVALSGINGIKSTGESLLELLGVILIFAIVLAACYFTTKFVAGKQLKQKNSGNIEMIETYTLSQNRYLALVRVGETYMVLSVAKDNITLLSTIPAEQLVIQEKNLATPSFSKVFSSFVKTGKANDPESKDDDPSK